MVLIGGGATIEKRVHLRHKMTIGLNYSLMKKTSLMTITFYAEVSSNCTRQPEILLKGKNKTVKKVRDWAYGLYDLSSTP